MDSEYRPLPFRWILPVAQILLSVAMFWPLRHDLAWQIQSSINEYRGRPARARGPVLAFDARDLRSHDLPSQNFAFAVDPHVVLPNLSSADWDPDTSSWRYCTPLMLNLPAGLLSVPYAAANPDKMEWTPKGMNFHYWRVISWPFVGLLFWWFAGRGVEAFVAVFKRKIHPALTPVDLTIAVLLVLAGVILFLTPLLGREPNDSGNFPWVLMSLSGVLWFAFGSATITARFLQRRVRRRLAFQADQPVSTA
jgi:hypothetical protein